MGIHLVGLTDHDGILPFEIRRRRTWQTTHSPTALLGPQQREQLNDALIELIDEWLGVVSASVAKAPEELGWKLTQDGNLWNSIQST